MKILKKMLVVFIVCIGIIGPRWVQKTEADEGELEDFGVIIHAGDERFPFTGLETVEGKAFDRQFIKDKYVLVTLWSTWCPYCDKENPSIQRLYEEYGGDTFTVMTVSLGEDEQTVRRYMEVKGYTFPVLLDGEEQLKERYAPRRPRSYLLDRGGYIIAEIRGGKDWAGIQAVRALGRLVPGFGGSSGL
jgi:thiol-disulfide isomerase/thioredoxin